MIDWIKKLIEKYGVGRVFLLLISVISIPACPILIQILYSYPDKMIFTVWGEDAFLGYMGSIIGGVFTLTALYITIKHEQTMRENDREIEIENMKKERELNERVFLTVDQDLVFKTFKDLREYAEKVGAYRIHIYSDWYNSETNKYSKEYDYITEQGDYTLNSKLGPSHRPPRIIGLLIENSYDRPVLNFKCKIIAECRNLRKREIDKKDYGESIIEVFSPGMKVIYPLPVGLDGNSVRIHSIDINYMTIAGETMHYSRSIIGENTLQEQYEIDGHSLFSSKLNDKQSTLFIDVRKINS